MLLVFKPFKKFPPSQQSTMNHKKNPKYEGWNFNTGNYLFTTDTK